MLTVNSVCWGPYDFGLILACGSSDGAISILTFTGDQQWDVKKFSAHTVSLEAHTGLSLCVSLFVRARLQVVFVLHLPLVLCSFTGCSVHLFVRDFPADRL